MRAASVLLVAVAACGGGGGGTRSDDGGPNAPGDRAGAGRGGGVEDGGVEVDGERGVDGAVGSDGPVGTEPFLNTLETPAAFAAMSSATGAEVKFLLPVSGREPVPPLTAPCTFQNTRLFTWHLQFLQSFPEYAALPFDAYQSLILRASRRLWAGALKAWSAPEHPLTHAPGVIAYGIYGQPGTVGADAIRAVDRTLKGCVPFARDLLVFVPDGSDQVAALTSARATLAAEGIASLFPEELVASTGHLAHSAGEGYGTLRIVPAGQPLVDYGPRDIVVVESAPNDISLVAGLISKHPQNELGHVNLRLREKGIPNVTVPRIYDAAWVRALDGALVHLVVRAAGFSLEPATLAAASAYWDAHRPHVKAPSADLTVEALTSFRALRASDASAYGPKAANLGELTRVLDLPHRNEGFGIPFARHRQFMRDSGLEGAVTSILAEPRLRTDASYKRGQLAALRRQIRARAFPEPLFVALRSAITDVFGASGATQALRFRSSSNVEDLDAFTGAGLYESKTGCLADDLDADDAGPSRCLTADARAALEAQRAARVAELAAHPERTWLPVLIADLTQDLNDEKPVRDAIRKVWASLWEDRAFDEREYYGIDHRLAFMGLAVHPTFAVERTSAVAVSNLTVDQGAPVYRLSSQVGSESVVRPEDPTSVAELLTFRREGEPPRVTQVRIEVRSNRLMGASDQVWPAEKLAEVGALLFRVHDHFAASVYPNLVILHLDFELKLSAQGDVVIKQVRPFSGTGN